MCASVCWEEEMNEAASLLRHTDKTKQQKRMDNKRLLYPHCVIMRNALCVCTRNRTDRAVWERKDVRSPVTSSYLILSVVASKSCLIEHVKLLPSHTHTSLCAAPIHSPLNTEVWQWLSVVADVSASVDSSDRRRLWRIRLAQQVACQSHPSHHFSPRTSESSTLTRRTSTCTLSSVLKEMGFKHTVPHVRRSIGTHHFIFLVH